MMNNPPHSAEPDCRQPRPAPFRRRRRLRRALGRVRDVLAVVGALFIVYHLSFEVSMVVSGSMAPTLQGEGGPGSDWVLYERISYRFREPRRWEVARYETDDHMIVAKRIVGLPGEHVGVSEGRVVIDGQQLAPPPFAPHLEYMAAGNVINGRQYDCGADGYYFLGDDTKDSYDSRFDGAMPRDAVRARAWLVIWPPSRFGFVR